MLEYFTYKRFKKHQADKIKNAHAEEVLSHQDEEYLDHMVSDAPQEIPLSNHVVEGEVGESSTTAATRVRTMSPPPKNPDLPKKKPNWKEGIVEKAKSFKMPMMPSLGAMTSSPASSHNRRKSYHQDDEDTKPAPGADDAELTTEERELHEALDRLNLAAQDGKAFSLSADTKTLLNKFTQILKDLVNGVPTAYDDLVKLFETSSTQIEKLFESTPGFIKKLIKTIPLGGKTVEGSDAEKFDIAAKVGTLGLPTLLEMVKQPGTIATTLKTVLNALKLRFPGLALGSNVLYSMGLFVLLFIFWYCYKRGRDVRLEKEAADMEATRETLGGAPDAPVNEPGTAAVPAIGEKPAAAEGTAYTSDGAPVNVPTTAAPPL